ncbi:MAG: hypothetical protein JSU86_08500 [Phycisphaerales bacterium]|nr:MAG: hypothetical protein JSU86_08500 [Phycisphaerales bacterium]
MMKRALEIENGRLTSRLLQNRHSGAIFRVSDICDTPCGCFLKVCCIDHAGDLEASSIRTIPWSMRGNYDALIPEGVPSWA